MRSSIRSLSAGAMVAILGAFLPASAQEAAKAGSEAKETAAGFDVRACGLRIVGQGYGENDNELRPFNWSPGTEVALLFVNEQGGLVAIDDNACKLISLKDDTGKNLVVKSGFFSDKGIGSFPKISGDGKAAMLSVEARGIPAPQAKSIQLKAAMVFQVASKKNRFEQKAVSLKAGSKITAGPVPMTIKEVESDDEHTELTVEAKKDLGMLASVQFLNDAGEALESAQVGSSRSAMLNSVTEERIFRIQDKQEKVTIALEYWADMQKVKVPVDLTVGLGLPEGPPPKDAPEEANGEEEQEK